MGFVSSDAVNQQESWVAIKRAAHEGKSIRELVWAIEAQPIRWSSDELGNSRAVHPLGLALTLLPDEVMAQVLRERPVSSWLAEKNDSKSNLPTSVSAFSWLLSRAQSLGHRRSALLLASQCTHAPKHNDTGEELSRLLACIFSDQRESQNGTFTPKQGFHVGTQEHTWACVQAIDAALEPVADSAAGPDPTTRIANLREKLWVWAHSSAKNVDDSAAPLPAKASAESSWEMGWVQSLPPHRLGFASGLWILRDRVSKAPSELAFSLLEKIQPAPQAKLAPRKRNRLYESFSQVMAVAGNWLRDPGRPRQMAQWLLSNGMVGVGAGPNDAAADLKSGHSAKPDWRAAIDVAMLWNDSSSAVSEYFSVLSVSRSLGLPDPPSIAKLESKEYALVAWQGWHMRQEAEEAENMKALWEATPWAALARKAAAKATPEEWPKLLAPLWRNASTGDEMIDRVFRAIEVLGQNPRQVFESVFASPSFDFFRARDSSLELDVDVEVMLQKRLAMLRSDDLDASLPSSLSARPRVRM